MQPVFIENMAQLDALNNLSFRCHKGHELKTLTIRTWLWGFCDRCNSKRKLPVSAATLSVALRVLPAVAQVTGGSMDVPLAAFKVVVKAMSTGALVIQTERIPCIHILEERIKNRFVVNAAQEAPPPRAAQPAAAAPQPRAAQPPAGAPPHRAAQPPAAGPPPGAASTPRAEVRPKETTMSAEATAKRMNMWVNFPGDEDIGDGSSKAPFDDCLSE
jgi:hypothetical protein